MSDVSLESVAYITLLFALLSRMNSAGVVGVLCSDKHGMCLTGTLKYVIFSSKHLVFFRFSLPLIFYSAQGVANASYSGSLTYISQLASTLEPGKKDPIILFEGPERYVFLSLE